jgi:hypothetical protein
VNCPSLDSIQSIPTKTLNDLLHQLKVDPNKFNSDITKIEQELLIRTLDYCRPVVDVI